MSVRETLMRAIARPLSVLLFAGAAATASTQVVPECNLDLQNAFGPFDYRTAADSQIRIVEDFHFTPPVERLIRGQSGTIGGDLDYTLRVFPNHSRALLAIARLARRGNSQVIPGARYTVDCWFQRALAFQPDDAQVRLVYGIELLKDARRQEALLHLQAAEALAPEDANVHYNLGLAYIDLGELDKSLSHAKRAYQLGFPLPGLRDKLTRAGKWKD